MASVGSSAAFTPTICGSHVASRHDAVQNERKNRRKRQEGGAESGAGGGRGAPDTTTIGASETAGHHASVRTAQATLPSRRPTASLDVTGLGNSVVSRLISRQARPMLAVGLLWWQLLTRRPT